MELILLAIVAALIVGALLGSYVQVQIEWNERHEDYEPKHMRKRTALLGVTR